MGFIGGKIAYRKGNRHVSVDFTQSIDHEDFSLEITESSVCGGSRLTAAFIPRTQLKIADCFLITDEKLTNENPVYLNGYQTWTDSREVPLSHAVPKLNLLAKPLLSMYGDYAFYQYGHGLHSWTYTYIRNINDGDITLYGSLTEKSGFTIFEYNKSEKALRVIKDCKGLVPQVNTPYIMFDLFLIKAEEASAIDSYFEAAGVPKPNARPCTGWTSWYNYYTDVTQADVCENLAAFSSRKLPIDIFQIDDGYQEAVGDWLLINKKFPQGMDYLADEIHKAGYKAGLWLAPIVCEKRSRVFKEHRDWVVAKAGINPGWSGIFYALDFYNPEVRNYLREVFDTVLNKWHYDMVKLDFLYAASLAPRKDKTRGQVMCEFFEFLREISGDKIILGCGAPLGCAFGLFDYCRVSSDVALTWEDKFLSAIHYRERVSTINALTSTIGRSHLNGRAFYNDPDVFILRNSNNKLTEDQKYTLFMINSVLGGLVFTSDNINDYTDSQLELMKTVFTSEKRNIVKAEKDGIVSIDYTIEENKLCLLCNLKPKKAVIISPYAGVLQRENRTVQENETLELRPYQTVCIQRK